MTATQAFQFKPRQVIRFRYARFNEDQRYRVVRLTTAPDKLWTHGTSHPKVAAVVIETIGVKSSRFTIAETELLALDPEEVRPGHSDGE
jgi:hypothetical protein